MQQAHDSSISALASFNGVLVTAAMDNVKIWSILDDLSVSLEQEMTTKSFVLSATLAHLPNSTVPVLFLGCVDSKIHLYIKQTAEFTSCLVLQGHSDWVTCLDVVACTETNFGYSMGDLMLVSGSQDKFIRLWRLTTDIPQITDLDLASGQISTKAHIFDANEQKYCILFDALLMGHEDWVHSVRWKRSSTGDCQEFVVVSASSDKSVMVWTPHEVDQVWVNVMLGEIGGSTQGFQMALFASDGSIVACSYSGALYRWKQENTSFVPCLTPTGHFDVVKEVSFNPSKEYFVSVSLDKTARAFAPYKTEKSIMWHEIARPQIHGYALHTLAFYDDFGFVSGADEKVLRVFEAPCTFKQSLEKIAKITVPHSNVGPMGAALPALGLTNKSVSMSDLEQVQNAHDARTHTSYTSAVSSSNAFQPMTAPPLEGHLTQNTLWPEVDKLYGHGYELITVCATKEKAISASKAAKSEHATLRVWNPKTWKQEALLEGHTLTCTKIRVSPDTNNILTVGRDRSIHVFTPTGPVSCEKAHARIIWDCDWLSNDVFATASRDKTVKIWKLSQNELLCWDTIKFDHSVTAIRVLCSKQDDYAMVVGLETGDLIVYSISLRDGSMLCQEKTRVDPMYFYILTLRDSHALSVNSIDWRLEKDGSCTIVTASDDCSIRMYSL